MTFIVCIIIMTVIFLVTVSNTLYLDVDDKCCSISCFCSHSLLPFAPRTPALDNTNNIIWCVTRAWCLRTDRTSGLLTNIVLHCEQAFETVLTIHEHQCASANSVDDSLKNVYRNVSIYRKCII